MTIRDEMRQRLDMLIQLVQEMPREKIGDEMTPENMKQSVEEYYRLRTEYIDLTLSKLDELVEKLIGEDNLTEVNGLFGVTHKDSNRNQLRAEQRKAYRGNDATK